MEKEVRDDVLDAFMDRAKAGIFDAGLAPRFYARVQSLRRLADYYERALIRHLKYEQGMTWQQVADAVDANLGSRQAAQVKWKRLIDDERGAGRKGVTAPGRPKRRPAESAQ